MREMTRAERLEMEPVRVIVIARQGKEFCRRNVGPG
jgi:hypothetical protein